MSFCVIYRFSRKEDWEKKKKKQLEEEEEEKKCVVPCACKVSGNSGSLTPCIRRAYFLRREWERKRTKELQRWKEEKEEDFTFEMNKLKKQHERSF